MTCDRTRWPIAHLIADGAVTHEGTRQLIAHADALFAQAEPFGLLMETRNPRGVEVPHIREWAEFLRSRRQSIERRLLGVGFVLPSPMMRGSRCKVPTSAAMPMSISLIENFASAVL